jgi:hypothetical protein
LPNRVEEAEWPRTVDGSLTPAMKVLATFVGGALLSGQKVLVAEFVLMLLLCDELPSAPLLKT